MHVINERTSQIFGAPNYSVLGKNSRLNRQWVEVVETYLPKLTKSYLTHLTHLTP